MEIEPGFDLVNVEHTYIVLDPLWMTIRTLHRFFLRAKRRERFFARNYYWDNPEGIERPPILLSGFSEGGISTHAIHGPILAGENGQRLALIDLGRVLEPGETEEVEIEHHFVRTSPDREGFVGHAAKAGGERILLTAVLPASVRPPVLFKTGRTGSDKFDSRVEVSEAEHSTVELPQSKTFTKEILNPKAGHRYRLSWDQRD